MLDWIFEGIATWIASIMTQIMDAISGVFIGALGTDMVAMEEYFPFAVSAYSIIQYTAWALLFLVVVWQIFRAFNGPLAETENPLTVLVRGSIFGILISYAKPIFSLALDIARAPYTALMDSTLDPGDFTFAGIEQAFTNGLTTLASVATVVGVILLIILMIALGWNYFKLLLETVERYVLVGVLCYTSPLAYAMGASKATSRVFQSWCRMVGSQLLLLVLNVWFLRAFHSSVGQFIANGGALTNGQGNIFLWFFCALALLKIAQRCDSYLAALGLSVAQTGSSMGVEMLMAARALTGFAKGGGGSAASVFGSGAKSGTGAATGGVSAGGILSGFMNRYKPNSFVRDAVVDGGRRMGAGGGIGFVGRTFGGMAARNGANLTPNSISSVATRPPNVSGTIGGEIADRSITGYVPQLAGGAVSNMTYSGTQITGGHISTTATAPDGRQAIVTILAYAGLRISECLELRLEDISLPAREITVRHGKGDKMRVVYFGDKITNAVREYLRSRTRSENPYLFPGQKGGHLTRGQVNRIFKAHSASITPHTLRHFFCSNALENGYSIGELANQAGHSNVHTTLLYTNPTREKMKEKANLL